MQPKNQPSKPAHQDFFRIELDRIVNESHPLVKLSARMDWQSLEEHFGSCFSEEGRLHQQKKTDKNKLYSMHEPSTQCIAKGKIGKNTNLDTKSALR
ncbi:MAG: hypothetical protein RSB24_01275 [Akkermansia sp.]